MNFSNFINGSYQPPISSHYFNNFNPADNDDKIGSFPDSTQGDVNHAVEAAKNAFAKWKNVPAPKRGDILRVVGDIFTKRKKELAKIMTREMGKPLFETEGDVQEAIDTCYYAASETRRMFGRTAPSELSMKTNLTFKVPIGVCGIITAWNFPIAVPSWKIIPAIAAGNTVVWKPSEDAPHSGQIFAEIMQEAGIPDGVFNVVHGTGKCGEYIVKHHDVKLIGFTGSTKTGHHIASLCGGLGKKVSLEMGGKNVQIVMNDANLDLALDGVLWGAFGTTGQRCTATSRLLLHSSIHDDFIKKLKEKSEALVIGSGLSSKTNMGPVINKKAVGKIASYFEIAKKEGLTLVTGGELATDGNLEKGNFIYPTIYTGATTESRLFKEEIFGPVLTVVKFDTFEEAIEIANNCEYGLSSSIFTRNVNNAMSAVFALETGITYVNAPTIGAEAHMPFGGVKGTGNGHREGGWTAFDIFTEWKTVYIDYSDTLQRAQIDNY